MPFLIGCVTYRSPFSFYRHQTGFIYSIRRTTKYGIRTLLLNPGSRVPKSEILLQAWPTPVYVD
jgi:hypothetical protein